MTSRTENDGDGLGIASAEDKIKRLQSQTQALEMQLAYRSEVTANASEDCRLMREKLSKTQKKYEDAKLETDELTQDMTRQYKGMQDDLLNKINERERIIQSLSDEKKMLIEEHEINLKSKEDIITKKNLEIEQWKLKLEELSETFGRMLSDVLGRMNERLEVHSARKNEDAVPIQHKMEEFSLQSNTTGFIKGK